MKSKKKKKNCKANSNNYFISQLHVCAVQHYIRECKYRIRLYLTLRFMNHGS